MEQYTRRNVAILAAPSPYVSIDQTARLLQLQPSWGGQQKYVQYRSGLLLITGRVGPSSPVEAAANARACILQFRNDCQLPNSEVSFQHVRTRD